MMLERVLLYVMSLLFLATASVLAGVFVRKPLVVYAPSPPPPKCKFTETDVREAVVGWEKALDIATMCVIDLDVCRQRVRP